MHDFSKPPHVTSPEETAKKRRLPVYILIIVGLFSSCAYCLYGC